MTQFEPVKYWRISRAGITIILWEYQLPTAQDQATVLTAFQDAGYSVVALVNTPR